MASAAQLSSWRRQIDRLRRRLRTARGDAFIDTQRKIAALERRIAKAER